MSSLSRLRRRPSAGLVVAVVALVFALSGAAVALPGKNKVDKNDIAKNAVTSKALKNGAVTGPKLGAGAVTEAKLGGGAVTGAKLADNAVTGAKVDEASLGTVPSATKATSAETAEKATSAQTAAKADTAEKANTAESANTANTANSATTATTATSATTAQTAAKATDAEALEGRPLAQVRSFSVGATDTTSQGLDDASYELVIAAPGIGIPTGGADLTVDASVELVNNGGGQAGAQCELRRDNVKMGASYSVTIPAGFSVTVPLTGFADNLPGTGLVDPEDVGVFCQGSIADDTISFTEGDLVVERIPTGL